MARPAFNLWRASSLLVGVLAAWPAAAAPGDTCAEATEIAALPFSSSGTTCGAGNDFTNGAAGTEVCSDLPAGYGGDDVFYKLTLQQGNQVAFELALPAGATGDLALFLVRAPSCSDPQVCAGNSVDLIGAGVGPERIKANAQAYPSGAYYVIVDSKLSPPDPASCGAYALTVSGHLSAFCGNGAVDPGEVCDDGNAMDGDCCSADCQIKAPTTLVCRPAPGDCDVAETCNADGTCPANAVRPAGSSCRPSAGLCDVAETCDGVNPTCPVDRFLAAGTACRAAKNICDETELCTGTQAACPADAVKPVGTLCGAASACEKAPICNGSGTCVFGGPVSCEDGNPCTADMCYPTLGCYHANICQDAGADDSPDASPDASPDGAPDAPKADAPGPDMSLPPPDAPADMKPQGLVPDAPPPSLDSGGRVDSIADAPAPADASLLEDAASMPTEGGPPLDASAGPFDLQSLPPGDQDGGSPRMSDAGAPLPGPPQPPMGLLPADAGRSMPQAGCSCGVGGMASPAGGSLGGLTLLTLLALLALRRRTT